MNSNTVGNLLRQWRQRKGYSQMQLALDAGTSSRHLSCVETGRAQAARDLLLRLAEVLDIPLRGRNALLNAAGFSAFYPETGLSEPEMAEARLVLEKILLSHQPYPAMLLDRNFNILLFNAGFDYLVRHFVADASICEERPWNMLKLLFDPRGWADNIDNIEEVLQVNIARANRSLALDGGNRELAELIQQLAQWRPQSFQGTETIGQPLPQLILPVHYCKAGEKLSLYTTATTLGAPQNITLQELLLESGYPCDPESEALCLQAAKSYSKAGLFG